MTQEPEIRREGWVVITPTVFQGNVLAWCTEEEGGAIPDVFESEEKAWKEIVDNYIDELQQFVDGERELDETSLTGPSEYPAIYVEFVDDSFIVFNEGGDPIIEDTLDEWRSKR